MFPFRYLLAEGSGDVIYAAFMGTKLLKDLIADVNAMQVALWEDAGGSQVTLVRPQFGKIVVVQVWRVACPSLASV